MTTIILGAGIAGLSLGYYLKKKGYNDFMILEKSGHIGGLLRKVEVGGHSFTIGRKNIRFRSKVVMSLLDELHIPYELVENDGRYFHLFEDGKYLMSPIEKNFSTVKRDMEVSNYQDVLNCHTNSKLVDILTSYAQKSNKYPLNLISADVSNKVVENEVKPEVIRADTGLLVHELARKLVDHIKLNATVKWIDPARRVFLVNKFERSYTHILFSSPLPFTIKMIKGFPNELSHYLDKLNYNTLMIVFAVYNESIFDPKIRSAYYPQSDIIFHRLNIDDEYSCSAEISFTKEKYHLLKTDFGNYVQGRVMNDIARIYHPRLNASYVGRQVVQVGGIIRTLGSGLDDITRWLQHREIYPLGRFAEWRDLEIHSTIEESSRMASYLCGELE